MGVIGGVTSFCALVRTVSYGPTVAKEDKRDGPSPFGWFPQGLLEKEAAEEGSGGRRGGIELANLERERGKCI